MLWNRGQASSERVSGRACRISFGPFATGHYLPHAKVYKRSWQTERSRVPWLVGRLGARLLDEITAQDVDGVLLELRREREPGTVNRYRSLISAIFKRAVRDGYAPANPVKAVAKLAEPAGRVAYLGDLEEQAILDALAPAFRPHFLFSINTGLRFSEQMNLLWRDVDVLTGLVTVQRGKNGQRRQVEMNSTVRGIVMDLAAKRGRPGDPLEHVFTPRPVQTKSFFSKAVLRAQEALTEAGKDPSRLDGYVWHSNRHSFASRLAMAGVDLLSIRELGGWKSLAMVTKYAHLAPGHRLAAVEAIVRVPELARNLPEPGAAEVAMRR
jgi:integrase